MALLALVLALLALILVVVLHIVRHHAEAHAQVPDLALHVHAHAGMVVLADVVVCCVLNDLGDALVQNADFGSAFQCIPGLAFFAMARTDLQVHGHNAHVLFGQVCTMLSVQIQFCQHAPVVTCEEGNHLFRFIHI